LDHLLNAEHRLRGGYAWAPFTQPEVPALTARAGDGSDTHPPPTSTRVQEIDLTLGAVGIRSAWLKQIIPGASHATLVDVREHSNVQCIGNAATHVGLDKAVVGVQERTPPLQSGELGPAEQVGCSLSASCTVAAAVGADTGGSSERLTDWQVVSRCHGLEEDAHAHCKACNSHVAASCGKHSVQESSSASAGGKAGCSEDNGKTQLQPSMSLDYDNGDPRSGGHPTHHSSAGNMSSSSGCSSIPTFCNASGSPSLHNMTSCSTTGTTGAVAGRNPGGSRWETGHQDLEWAEYVERAKDWPRTTLLKWWRVLNPSLEWHPADWAFTDADDDVTVLEMSLGDDCGVSAVAVSKVG